MFPPIPPIIDMIYQIQPNPFVSFVPGFNPNPIIQQMPQRNAYLSQLIHTQQILSNRLLQSASMFVQQQQQHQQHQHQHQQLQQNQLLQISSLPYGSTTEINDQTSFQQETSFGSTIKFATWNVRGAMEMDKRNAIDKCLNDKMIEIACIQETKLQMTNLDTCNYKWHFISQQMDHNFHCGTAILVKHNFQAAVSNFEAVTGNILSCFVKTKELTILVISAHFTEDFGNEVEFERLKNFLKLYESLPTIILGDFNAKLGKTDIADEDYVFMGRFLYHDKCNDNGRLLKDLASEAKLFIKNTFRSHNVHKWKFILTTCKLKEKTKTSKAEETQIDHILISRDGILLVKMLRGYYIRGNNIQTDHKMIVADVEIRNLKGETNDKSEVIDLSQEDDVPGEYSEKRENNVNVGENNVSEATLEPTINRRQHNRQNRKKLRTQEIIHNKRKRRANLQLEQTQVTRNNTGEPYDIEQDDLEVSIGNSNIEDVEMQISPGEPVPPGFEDVVKPVAELQVMLSKYRTAPLIGLEYIIELIMGDRRPRTYHCALCDRICDTKEIIDHITCYDHRCKYLDKHFSTVMSLLSQYRYQTNAKDVLDSVVEEVCDSIEVAYGRMVPSVFENNDYTTNRAMYMKKLASERHFDEKSGSTFAGVIDHKAIQTAFETAQKFYVKRDITIMKKARAETMVRNKRSSFDSISSSESMPTPSQNTKRRVISRPLIGTEPVVIDEINLDLISSDEDESCGKRRKKSSPHSSPTSVYKNDETEEFKYERYRNLAQQAVEDLTILLKEYEKYPEKHPLYPSEWNRYWLRRSEQLKSVGIDPRNFDFSSEWSKYWLKRMRELYDEDVALKKFEIRKKLNLSSDFYPKSSSSYGQISSSSNFNKSEIRDDDSRRTSMTNYTVDTVHEDADDEPLTVISVLRLLTAFEDLLGASLGPKVVDLLSKAVALEKVKANLADDLLMSEENSVFLDTIKEKLKGLIIADVLKSHQINAVRRVIKNVASIVAVIDNKILINKARERGQLNQNDKSNVASTHDQMWTEKPIPQPEATQSKNNIQKVDDSRSDVCKQIATAFLIQKINISNERLEKLADLYMSKSNTTAETPYLFGVHVSQKFLKNNEISDFGNAANSGNSSNLFSRNNTTNQIESYSQPKSSQSNLNMTQLNQSYRSQDQSHCNSFNQQNSTHSIASINNNNNNLQRSSFSQQDSPHAIASTSLNSNQQSQQRNLFSQQTLTHPTALLNNSQHSQQHNSFSQQNSMHPNASFNDNQYNQQRNSFQQQNLAKLQHTQKLNNHLNNHYGSSNKRKSCQVQIWDSKPVMTNQSDNNGFDRSTKINSIWDTNPIQNQQQFNQKSSQRHNNEQSHYVWGHQQQNNRNRH